MGYKHDEHAILDAAVAAVLEDGLSQLTYGRLARRMGIADRSIVYYFPTKTDLLARTVAAIGARLQTILDEAFGAGRFDRYTLSRRAWPVLTRPDADPVFRVFFELVGLGTAGVEPFDTVAPAVVEAWVDWLVTRIEADDAAQARAIAYATIATLDGLLLLRLTCGAAAADSAAAELDLS